MNKIAFSIIAFATTFMAWGYNSQKHPDCKQQSIILEQTTAYSSARDIYLSDYFDLVEFALVVDDYTNPRSKYPEQVYSLTPILKLRPNNFTGIFTKKRYIPAEILNKSPLTLSVKQLRIEGGNNCKSCETTRFGEVNVEIHNMPSTTFKPEIPFNPMAEVGDDGTITISTPDPIGYVKNLEDIKNAKGMYFDIIVENGYFSTYSDYVGTRTYGIYGWTKRNNKTKPEMAIPDSVCKFKIKATSHIQKRLDSVANIMNNKGLSLYRGDYPWKTSHFLFKGTAEYYYRESANGERIYEDHFSFRYNNKDNYWNYLYISGNFKNDKQVGTWNYTEHKGYIITIHFNDDGILDGEFIIKRKVYSPYNDSESIITEYSGKFKDSYLYELDCSSCSGKFNKNGRPIGKWRIYSSDSPVSNIEFNSSGGCSGYYFDSRTGDKKIIPSKAIDLPRDERRNVMSILNDLLFRSSPTNYMYNNITY